MSAKAEFILILILSFGTPLITYPFAYSYFAIDYDIENESTPSAQSLASSQQMFQKTEPLSLLFVGDIMLDRTIRLNGDDLGYESLFSCLKDEFSSHDAVIGNLEGAVTNHPSVSAGAPYEAAESFRFTFDPDAVEALVNIGLSIVSIGNNHIRDFGNEGINQTLAHTKKLGLDVFGDPRKNGEKYIVKEFDNTKIAFIAHNQFFGTQKETLENLIDAQSNSDLQIIFSHWGDEYVPARKDTKVFAHELVDNGADLIIGAHPHVIQEHESYNDVWIYYSLGNFIFDQYWDNEVQTGLALKVLIQDGKVLTIEELEVESKRREGTCFKNAPVSGDIEAIESDQATVSQ